MPLFRTLLVDDDDIVREVLGIMVVGHEHLNLVGAVATGEEAILAAARLRPDLIILDLCLPGLSGMDTLRCILKSLPQVRILVVSAGKLAEEVQQAFDGGAAGYVFKPSSRIDLPEAVRALIAGHTYSSPALCRNSISA
jgi:DNA-binding NarL/FixJ family response regulator